MPNSSLKEAFTDFGTKQGSHDSSMDGSMKLVVLSVVMLLGSYLAGSIPLFIAMSEEKLQVNILI